MTTENHIAQQELNQRSGQVQEEANERIMWDWQVYDHYHPERAKNRRNDEMEYTDFE